LLFGLSGLTLALGGAVALGLWGEASGILMFAIGVGLWLVGQGTTPCAITNTSDRDDLPIRRRAREIRKRDDGHEPKIM